MNNTPLRAILVDDEHSAITSLSIILEDFCPEIKVVGTANHVDEAIPLLKEVQPDVVFLDIEMPDKSGFTLLEHIDENVQVVFITAYHQYAVRAFEVSAVDYLLKPTDISRLLKTVEKLKKNIQINNKLQLKIVQENIEEESIQKFVLPYKDTYIAVPLENIICMEAEGMYTTFSYEENGSLVQRMFSRSLKHYEQYITDDPNFFRVHRSWIVNKDKIEDYSKTTKDIKLVHHITVPLSRGKNKAFLDWLYGD